MKIELHLMDESPDERLYQSNFFKLILIEAQSFV